MGQQITVRITREPEWGQIAPLLESVGLKAVVRMIDGLPAFPDEIPEPGWKELRLSLDGGMVTLRREPEGIACVVWGNAQGDLIRSWKACAWAIAKAGNSPDAFEEP